MEFCIKNEDFCIINDDFCIKNDGFCRPDEPGLEPLADRFLFAAELRPVSRSVRLKLLDRNPDENEPSTQETILIASLAISVDEMDEYRDCADRIVAIPLGVEKQILELLELLDKGAATDRRYMNESNNF